MYDTINLILKKEDYPKMDFLRDIPECLTQVSTEGESRAGVFVNGFLDNFKVSINQHRVKVQHASLAKFINGDNQQGMSLGRTREAIGALSDKLSLNVEHAKVTRLDVGRNITTQFSPELYFPYLGELVNYKRLEQAQSLYYQNGLRALVFYNKLREVKEKRQKVEPLFANQNLLRYELRFTSHLERQFNVNKVSAGLLYDEEFYIGLGKRWRDLYLDIGKISNQAAVIVPTTSTRNLIQNLASLAVNEVGGENLLRTIAEWQEEGHLTRKQASDHRAAIRDLVRKEMREGGNELIEELDKKIKTAIRFFL
jgi:hypothetical protein